jgi:Cu+-exporting ATPase
MRLSIEGMTCAACVGRVERTLRKVPGVTQAVVNLATGEASVEGDSVSLGELKAAVEKAGYRAEENREKAAQSRQTHGHNLERDLKLAATLSIPLVLVSMLPMYWPALHHWQLSLAPMATWNWLAWLLATPVQFGPGGRFYRHGWAAARALAPDMNTLVMLGTSAAYFYSLAVCLGPGFFPAGAAHVYFESSAAVITFVLLGKLLEGMSKGRAGQSIERLLSLRPSLARLVKDGQPELEVPVDQVQLGDLVRIRPGERIPVDAEVVDGETYVDESLLTGESAPVRRGPGERVIGGTLNGPGSVLVRAVAVGADSTLARIVRLVEEAQATRLPIQQLADRVVRYFTPVALVISLATFVGWLLVGGWGGLPQALTAAVSVLVIACPCAMGLATPISVLVASGRGAELGVLFRGGDALEAMAGLDKLAFDKTGTLTLGQPQVTAVIPAVGISEEELLRLAGGAEQASEHPLGRAVIQAAQGRGLRLPAPEGFQATVGLGLRARVDGRAILIGSARFLEAEGVSLEGGAGQDLAGQGVTVIQVALDGEYAGLLGISDPPRPEAPAVLARLRGLGLALAMVSGDQSATASAVAKTLGVEEVRAQALPADKVAAVQAWRSSGARLGFVGDGVNDAPALAAADLGIAMGSGTDVAMESAQVILTSSDLRSLLRALELARATLANIRMNLIWAFGYNIILIPVAAGGGLSPLWAGAAMAVSSLFVVTNALRLRRFKASL